VGTKPISVKARKPLSVWKKPVTIKGVQLVAGLAKGIFNAATCNVLGVASSAEQLLSSVTFDSGSSELAWRLVLHGIIRAIFDLVGELRLSEGTAPSDATKLERRLEEALANTEITIGRMFFDHPSDLPILNAIEQPLTEWLETLGVTKADARNTVRRLPSYFAHALHEEWRSRPEEYKSLFESLNSPFARASERERAWERYSARLQRQINEPLLGESFGIVHVYVPLCAFYEEDALPVVRAPQSGGQNKDEGNAARTRRVVIRLHDVLHAWVDHGEKNDAIRVITGGPGSGKSSFAKMFAAEIATKGRRALYVPLHLLDPEKDLEIAIGQFVRQQDIFPGNPLDAVTSEPPILLVLDGLDELAMQGRAAAEVAQKFVREVQRFVANRNQAKTMVQVVLGGRDIVVQINRADFRAPRQVLHLLPYYLTFDQRQRFHDPNQLLWSDKRDQWWEGYAAVKRTGRHGTPRELRRSDLEEITAQPLLGYLVALSFDRGTVDFSKSDVNRNAIYADLVEAVYERGYGGAQHPSVRGLTLEQFRQLLEEVALATWHGDGRTTTITAIYDWCKLSGLESLLSAFEEGAQAGTLQLLTAFYFRQSEGRLHGERTFEFTHKTFREYLTARRIIRAVERIDAELATRKAMPGRGWGEREALVHWVQITGMTAIDEYIWEFIAGEARNLPLQSPGTWQKVLAGLAGVVLRQGLPIDSLNPRPSYPEEARQARNSEEALLACMSAFGVASKRISDVQWPEPESFGSWFKCLTGQRNIVSSSATPQYLQNLNLSLQHLDFADLRDANLNGADLSRASLVGANLVGAKLVGANLNAADLTEARLGGADLSGADLSNADFTRARFYGADPDNPHLANLREANFQGARLEGAQIVGQQLQQARGTPRVLKPS